MTDKRKGWLSSLKEGDGLRLAIGISRHIVPDRIKVITPGGRILTEAGRRFNCAGTYTGMGYDSIKCVILEGEA